MKCEEGRIYSDLTQKKVFEAGAKKYDYKEQDTKQLKQQISTTHWRMAEFANTK